LTCVDNDIKDAAMKQWPDGETAAELVCRFVRPSGAVIEEEGADAWDKTTYELTKLFVTRGIITEQQSVAFVDEGVSATPRPLSPSVVLYPKEVCETLSKHEKRRGMPRLIMVVSENRRQAG
jgi:hypothetical protein